MSLTPRNVTNPFAVAMDELDMLLLESGNKSDPDSDDLLADDYGYGYGYGGSDATLQDAGMDGV
jgi:hypothetical protein